MSKHLKRMNAPTAMRISRKEHYWVAKPAPGPHPVSRSVPLIVLVRDYLGLAERAREAKVIIANKEVKVDGRPVTDRNYPVGLMDVISIEKTGAHYRMLLDYHGRLVPLEISKEEAGWKLCRIEDARTLKGGVMQFNLHDGRNIQTTKAKHKPGDTLQIEVPTQKIKAAFEFKAGASALIISGTHTGQLAKVASREVVRSSFPDIVKFEEGISTVWPNVFVVGRERSEIQVPEKVIT